MKILAIDPGIERTGWSIFSYSNKSSNKITLEDYGLISTSKIIKLEKRISLIQDNIELLIKNNSIKEIVLEKIFFFKNQKTIIQVSQAQGAIMAIAGKNNIILSFLTPLEIKQIVTGYGQADKISVKKMLEILLKIKFDRELDDVIDAIACGYAYCINKKSYDR